MDEGDGWGWCLVRVELGGGGREGVERRMGKEREGGWGGNEGNGGRRVRS